VPLILSIAYDICCAMTSLVSPPILWFGTTPPFDHVGIHSMKLIPFFQLHWLRRSNEMSLPLLTTAFVLSICFLASFPSSSTMSSASQMVHQAPPLTGRSWNDAAPSTSGARIVAHMQAITSAYIPDMKGCGLCGRTVYGYPSLIALREVGNLMGLPTESFGVPPAELANPNLDNRCDVFDVFGDRQSWLLCKNSCHKQPLVSRTRSLVPLSYAYTRQLLSLPVSTLQRYSVLNLEMHLHKQLAAHAKGELRRAPTVNGLLLGTPVQCPPSAPDAIHAAIMGSSAVYQHFLPMNAWPGAIQGLNTLPMQVFGNLTDDVVMRAHGGDEAISSTTTVGTIIDALPAPVDYTANGGKHLLGDAFLRRELRPRSILTDSNDRVLVDHRALPFTPTVELLMAPFLFPDIKGHFQRAKNFTLDNYCKERFQQFFTAHTLYIPYVLEMYQWKLARQLQDGVKWVNVKRRLDEARKTNPALTQHEHFNRETSHAVPASVPGSPSFFRDGLHELLSIVDTHGMPSAFLTLTMDDASNMRWQEVHDLETHLNRFNAAFTATDAPVECSALFHRKLQDFLSQFVLPSTNHTRSYEILGRVTHHFIRYATAYRACVPPVPSPPTSAVLLPTGVLSATAYGMRACVAVLSSKHVARRMRTSCSGSRQGTWSCSRRNSWPSCQRTTTAPPAASSPPAIRFNVSSSSWFSRSKTTLAAALV
jgi:hypothetical protein